MSKLYVARDRKRPSEYCRGSAVALRLVEALNLAVSIVDYDMLRLQDGGSVELMGTPAFEEEHARVRYGTDVVVRLAQLAVEQASSSRKRSGTSSSSSSSSARRASSAADGRIAARTATHAPAGDDECQPETADPPDAEEMELDDDFEEDVKEDLSYERELAAYRDKFNDPASGP
jgi:hypothetical protein